MPHPKLPEALGCPYEHFDLQADGEWLVIADSHIPFHDVPTLNLAIDMGVRKRVAGVLLNGDVVDFHKISKFYVGLDAPDYDKEIDTVIQFLQYLRWKFPKARIVFKEGNHEERLCHYLYRKCPEIRNLKKLTLPALLEFDRFGIEHVGDGRVMKLGKLHVIHGHEYSFAIQNPVNPARGLHLRAENNAMCAHFHVKSEDHWADISDTQFGCWSTGCCCLRRPPQWRRLNKWQNGFATVEVANNGWFSVRNYQTLDGKVL